MTKPKTGARYVVRSTDENTCECMPLGSVSAVHDRIRHAAERSTHSPMTNAWYRDLARAAVGKGDVTL